MTVANEMGKRAKILKPILEEAIKTANQNPGQPTQKKSICY
jgi:hypothetical protein